MKFNLHVCEFVRVTQKKSPLLSSYFIENHTISQTGTETDLGVVVNDNLKWCSHISSITSKANKMLGFLYRTSDPRFGSAVKRYLSLIRTYLGYASEEWTPLHIGGLQTVEGDQ